jgi:hypothetical protein
MRKKQDFFNLLSLAVILAVIMPGGLVRPSAGPAGEVLAAPEPQVLQETYSINLSVISARTEPKAGVLKGDDILEYQFLINVDNTGDPFFDWDNPEACMPFIPGEQPEDPEVPNPDYPESCDLPGIRTVPAWSPIYTQGDQDDLSMSSSLDLPPGKYLISVTADGFKLDGEHFTVPDDGPLVVVEMHPFPLPPASMTILVFEDNALTNGQYDFPAEHGLAGFRVSLNDIAGEITTDIFGNPLCTVYQKDGDGNVVLDPDGMPVIETLGRGCYSDAEGIITIPNIGPMRYDVLVFPPTGEPWVQTTTLEGSHGWDTWLQEAGTGMDNEFLVAAEPFPWTIFGYVMPNAPNLGGTGSIEGVIMAAATYVPAQGGLPYIGDTFGGFAGTKLHRPIIKPWLSLNSLTTGDAAVWVGQGNVDGTFYIPDVPEGSYFLTYWDDKQHYILDFVQVDVKAGEVTNTGIRMLTGWFTEVYGTVFHDINGNGRRDDGEPGIPDYIVVLRDRDNTEIDRMSIFSATNGAGFYELEKGYPMGSWMVLEAYSDLHKTTGVTYQTLNMLEEKTIPGAIVDIGLLPVLGQPVRLDWGVQPYEEYENGGIAGTVFYDTVRAEDNAQYAGAEPWQPGIPGLTMKLWEAELDDEGQLVLEVDGGAAVKKRLLAVTETETYARPKGCTALDADGNPITFSEILPDPEAGKDCLEGPLMGTQIGDGQNDLDGNWGFGEGCVAEGDYYDEVEGACAVGEPEMLPPGHYLVEVVIPEDAFDKPMFQVTREEDLNVFDGDEFMPMVPPPACAGPLHIVDIMDVGVDGYDPMVFNGVNVPGSTPVYNPGFADAYPSRYEGNVMPLCNVKHVYLQNGKAVAPIFNLFTEVPIPGKWRGYIIDNLNVSVDPTTLFFGEMAGVPNVPIGLYDYSGRLVHTVHSDRDGVYEVLMPSTGTYNAPAPSGMFANVYYQYGNDPGPIGRPNVHYNPQFRSIGTSFEIYPGVTIPADLAPNQNGGAVWSPGSQYNRLALCSLSDEQPQLFAVDKPYGAAGVSFTITGRGFGTAQGGVTLSGLPLTVTAWSETSISATIPGGFAAGEHQLLIHAANGLSTVSGLTFHVLGAGYSPTVYEVGPDREFDPADYGWDVTDPNATIIGGPIQAAIDAGYHAGGEVLIVVYPGLPVPMVNTQGIYLENPVMYYPLKLQGVGPGGILPNGDGVSGSIIDGRGVGGDTPLSEWWREWLLPVIWNDRGGWDRGLLDGDGNPYVNEGAVITVFGEEGEFTEGFKASVDGFLIQGGDQQGFPNALLQVGGLPEPINPLIVVQGGGIFIDGHAPHFQITNNLIQGNGGTYGGAIRLGWAHIQNILDQDGEIEVELQSNHIEGVRIAHNRIVANGGINLGGAIAVFNGADGYEIAYNDICGNSSVEYGGGISHYGMSPGGEIHHNRIYYNSSYDEGGGIMIAGELPYVPGTLSEGAGEVKIYNNRIQANLANDDGGGLRFLMAGPFEYEVVNNIIANNVSTHEGGGISLNDAPYVTIAHNTIMDNLTTGTALTSNGTPAPAGLSSSRNSVMLQGILPLDYPHFSNPVVVNNLFWDNRAGYWAGTGIYGLGLEGDPSAIFYWDLGVADGSGVLNPQNNLLQVAYPGGTNNIVNQDPLVVSSYDTKIRIFPWRTNFNFVGINIVAVDTPVTLMGDYHLQGYDSPAVDAGMVLQGLDLALKDIDGDSRPQNCVGDIGVDELIPVIDPLFYFSIEVNNNTPQPPWLKVPVDDIDIYGWDGMNYWCIFDGSAAGIPAAANLEALNVLGPDDYLMSFSPSVTLPGLAETVRAEDIVRYQDGVWSLFFDGSDVGLADSQGIDAFALLSPNQLVVSMEGSFRFPNPVGGTDGEDLLKCTGTFGANTTCTWSWFFDGSDVGLKKGTEVDGVSVAPNGDIYLSAYNAFTAGSLTAAPEDIFVCHGPTLGATTRCTSTSLYFDGSVQGLTTNLDALDLAPSVATGLFGTAVHEFWFYIPSVMR